LGGKSASGEGIFSDNHIIHLFTISLLMAQSAAPAGGRPVRSHRFAKPRAATVSLNNHTQVQAWQQV